MTERPAKSFFNRRTTALALLLLLLAGAAINVAVAWTCASIVQYGNFGWKRLDPLAQEDKFGGDISTVEIGAQALYVRGNTTNVEIVEGRVPRWARSFVELSDEQSLRSIRLVDARGWPLLSMVSITLHSEFDEPGMAQSSFIDSGIPISDRKRYFPMAGYQAMVLPLRPLWPGFAINTLFYAAICWFLFCSPFVIRKWWRWRKALCPACAYPVGVSAVCTECGRSVRT